MAGEENGGDKSRVKLSKEPEKVIAKAKISVFLKCIEDDYGDMLRFNEMTGKPEWYNVHTDSWQQWTDANDAQITAYFQDKYELYSPRMLENAVTLYFENKKVNPLLQLLESLKWDGQNRIENFLHFATQCEDTPYTREVSRLIFAGGIHRAYQPGCKFDDMVVLVGRQAKGKSTLVRWLAMDDKYFREIKTINGKEGIETLRGVWIGEVAELMAMTKVKEMEAVKAYITSQEDSYRAPYERYVKTIPRRCIFIGTTNTFQFLTDKTGNRRFYPVQCNLEGYDLFNRETEIKAYIKQCWAEAVVRYHANDLNPYARRDMIEAIREAQSEAEEDDWRVGAIQAFLEDAKKAPNSMTCVIELWHRALNEPEEKKPSRSDSIDISKIVNQLEGWERCKKTVKMPPWGAQKVWKKVPDNYYPF